MTFEEWRKDYYAKYQFIGERCDEAKAAWDARGEVDASLAEEYSEKYCRDTIETIVEAIRRVE